MEEVRKRRHLTPEEKFQIYNEAVMAAVHGNGSIAEVLRLWGIHSSDLTRIRRTVEEGAIVQFKVNKSRKPKDCYRRGDSRVKGGEEAIGANGD